MSTGTGLLLGLVAGLGRVLRLVVRVGARPPAAPAGRGAGGPGLEDALVQAGVRSVSVGSLAALCVGAAVGVFVVVLLVSSAPFIAACFALMAAWAPVALVRYRAAQDGARTCGRSGPRSSTTSPRACAPACRCPRRSPSCPSAGRSSCARPSRSSPRTTGPAAASPTPCRGSRTGSRTRSPTGSWRRCGSPARSAARTSGGCCGRCRPSSARTPGPGASSRPASPGR